MNDSHANYLRNDFADHGTPSLGTCTKKVRVWDQKRRKVKNSHGRKVVILPKTTIRIDLIATSMTIQVIAETSIVLVTSSAPSAPSA